MRRLVRSFIIVLLLVFSMNIAAQASGVDDKQKELDKVNENIQEKKEQIDFLEYKQNEVAQQIDEIEARLERKNQELQNIENDLQKAEARLKETEAELQKAADKAENQENLMGKRLRAMYMTGTTSYLQLLLESKDFNDFLNRFHLISEVVRFDNEMLNSMQQYRDEVNEKKNQLDQEKKEIEAYKARAAKQKESIQQDKKDQEQLLDQLQDEQEVSQKALDELEAVSNQLVKTIQDLQAKEEAKKRSQQQPVQYTGGKFTWPVPGFYRITSPFGYRIHPIYKTKKLHTGIDIGSNYSGSKKISIYGTNFVAAGDGVVIFAGLAPSLTSGYGRCVIIDHGGGISTLYGHGSQILVSVGQRVKKGQPVLKVGSTGASTGAHAHFEVRVNGTPTNPMSYLQ